jgi:hypothetical protein
LIASLTPTQDPVYLMNCGLCDWKRIFTRSSGATIVLACERGQSTTLIRSSSCAEQSKTYRATGKASRDTRLPHILEAPFIRDDLARDLGLVVGRANRRGLPLRGYRRPRRIGSLSRVLGRQDPRHGGMCAHRGGRGQSLSTGPALRRLRRGALGGFGRVVGTAHYRRITDGLSREADLFFLRQRGARG